MGRPAILSIKLVADTKAALAELDITEDKLSKIGKAIDDNALKALKLGGAGSLAAALAPIAAAATSAGAALGGLGLVAVPQFAAITTATQTLAKAQAEQAAGSKTAVATMAEYRQELAAMPAATRDTAAALTAAKGALKEWSDSLAPETMPLFTTALNGLRESLPAVTPLVTAATKAVKPFIDQFENAARNGTILRFTTELSGTAGPVLSNFIKIVEGFGKAFGSTLLALGPPAQRFSEDMATMATRFGDVTAQSRGSGDGVDKFASVAGQASAQIVPLIETAGHLLSAMSPLIGVSTQLAAWFLKIIDAVPTGALQVLGPLLVGLAAAIKVVTIATTAWEAVQVILDAELTANPIGLVVVAVAALAAGIVYAYNHSKTFRDILDTVWSVIKRGIELYLSPAKLAFELLRDAIGFVVDKVSGLIDWFGRLNVPNPIHLLAEGFGAIRDAIQGAWDLLKKFIDTLGSVSSSALSWIPGFGFFSAPANGSPSGFGLAGRQSFGPGNLPGREVLVRGSGFISVSIDGQQLQARINRSVSNAMERDGARLAAGGWN